MCSLPQGDLVLDFGGGKPWRALADDEGVDLLRDAAARPDDHHLRKGAVPDPALAPVEQPASLHLARHTSRSIMKPVDVVPWLSAGCPVMGILMGQCWHQKDYVTTLS